MMFSRYCSSLGFFTPLLLIVLGIASPAAQAQTSARVQDSLALVTLYNSTDGAQWNNDGGWLTNSLGNWSGVTLSGGRVTGLNLTNNNLRGSLPAALGDLAALTFLDLSDNQLTGDIPVTLGNLTSLERLYLHRNQLSGSIPATLGNLENLLDLFLFRNQLTGTLPPSLGRLGALEELWLFINRLDGEIPAALGELDNLRTLWVSDNQLRGEVPAALGQLGALQRLFLYRNQLTGALPAELADLDQLTELRLYGNFLTSSTAVSFGTMDRLQTVGLHDNQLSFESLLPSLEQSYDFYYNPQRLLGEPDTVNVDAGESYIIDLGFRAAPGDVYRWYQNHQFVTQTSEPELALANIDPATAGVYHCVVRNPAIDDFVLLTAPRHLTVDGALPCPPSFLSGGTYRARSRSARGASATGEISLESAAFGWTVNGFQDGVTIVDTCRTLEVRGLLNEQEPQRVYGYPVLLSEAADSLSLYWLQDIADEANTSFTVLTITNFTLTVPDVPNVITADAGQSIRVTLAEDDDVYSVALDGSGSSSTYAAIDESGYVWTRDGQTIATGVRPSVPLAAGTYTITLTVTDNEGNQAQGQVVVVVNPYSEDIDPAGEGQDERDTVAPVVISNDSRSSYDRLANPGLTLQIQAADNVGIASDTLYYAGLTTSSFEQDQRSELVAISGNTYRLQLPAAAVDAIDDPLGIRYVFALQDTAGNRTLESGEVYWSYPDTTFRAASDRVGPWRTVADAANPSTSDYSIIALPFEPQPVRAVLAALGEPDPTQWRLFRYDEPGFREYGQAGFARDSDLEPGHGYFLIRRPGDSIRFGGQIAALRRENEQYVHTRSLRPGWNLIGNPFPFTVDWRAVQDDPLNEAIAELLPLNRLARGEDDYVPTTTLDAFAGAFLYWPEDSAATLYLSPAAGTTTNGRSASAPAPASEGWELPLVLMQDEFYSSRAGIGMRRQAVRGIDRYDALSVPKLRQQPELLVQDSSGVMNRSVVPWQAQYQWQAAVTGVAPGQAVTLRWDQRMVADLPQALYLWDAQRARLLDMADHATYRLVMSNQGSYPLQLYYGSPADIRTADQVSVGALYPNPANTSATLPVIIPSRYQRPIEVRATLTNQQGQAVGHYTWSLSAGYHTLALPLDRLRVGLYYYQLRLPEEQSRIFSGKVIKQ